MPVGFSLLGALLRKKRSKRADRAVRRLQDHSVWRSRLLPRWPEQDLWCLIQLLPTCEEKIRQIEILGYIKPARGNCTIRHMNAVVSSLYVFFLNFFFWQTDMTIHQAPFLHVIPKYFCTQQLISSKRRLPILLFSLPLAGGLHPRFPPRLLFSMEL